MKTKNEMGDNLVQDTNEFRPLSLQKDCTPRRFIHLFDHRHILPFTSMSQSFNQSPTVLYKCLFPPFNIPCTFIHCINIIYTTLIQSKACLALSILPLSRCSTNLLFCTFATTLINVVPQKTTAHWL